MSVKAVIRNDAGDVLCVTESERGMWELPGGGLDHGETIEQGLARELEEEIGYTGKFTYTFADATPLYEDMSERCMCYIAFNVTLERPEAITPGIDVFQMEYKDPTQFTTVGYRGGQMIYKHDIDHAFPIKFDRLPHE